MHTGKQYSFKEVIVWTRKDLYFLLVLAMVPTFLYEIVGWKWIAIPWLPVALMGTAVAFVVGFKNNASYDRLWEGRRVWGAITNVSRTWGIMVRDFVTEKHTNPIMSTEEVTSAHKRLYLNHFAWLTALRFQLREPKAWESIYKAHNAEYKNKFFKVEEHESTLADALKPYLTEADYTLIMSKTNKAAAILALQSSYLLNYFKLGLLEDFRHMELEKLLAEMYTQQGASERIKNFPYPRQYATLNLWFIKIFIILLPFGMLQEFEKMGENFIWLSVPFSVLSCWIFTTMEKIGESSESPFEGSANDVPITTISRNIEIDLREMLHEQHTLKPLAAQNLILT